MEINEKNLQAYVANNIIPKVKKWEKNQFIDRNIYIELGEKGFLGCNVPLVYGGSEMSMQSIGIINKEFSKASSSIRSVFTTHGMVQHAILKWGTETQRKKWLPKLTSGKLIGSFALAEDNSGSDAGNIAIDIQKEGNCFVINGKKTWVTLGGIADVFLVFGKYNGNTIALLVEKDESIQITRNTGLMGLKAAMIADVEFNRTIVSENNMIGSDEAGQKFILPSCLDYGRYTISWASLGIIEECVCICNSFSEKRVQFNEPIKNFELVQKMLTEMITLESVTLAYCKEVAKIRENADFDYVVETMKLKYFSTKTANKITNISMQVLGSRGFTDEYPVERFYRDAKANEIIEGTSQILEILISKNHIEKGMGSLYGRKD